MSEKKKSHAIYWVIAGVIVFLVVLPKLIIPALVIGVVYFFVYPWAKKQGYIDSAKKMYQEIRK